MKQVNKFFFSAFLGLLLLLLGFNNSVKAQVSGMYITYQCTQTPGVYQITARLFRNCAGLPLCACEITGGPSSNCTIQMQIFGQNGNNFTQYGTVNLSVVPSISGFDAFEPELNQPSLCSNCNRKTPGTISPAAEWFTFQGTVNLNSIPANVCNVKIGYSILGRNANVAFQESVNAGYYSECTINRCVSACNSSPVVNNFKFLYRVNTLQTYAPIISDPDGDSVSIHLAPSLSNLNQSVVYNPSYSANAPFPYLGFPSSSPPLILPSGIEINQENKTISFRPTATFTGALVLELREWRKINNVDSFVGSTRIDHNIYAVNISNNQPFVRTYNNVNSLTAPQPQINYTIVANQNWCITVAGVDNDVTDTTDILLGNSNIANEITFTKLINENTRQTVGPRHDSVRICWTPSLSRARTTPYVLPLFLSTRNINASNNPFKSTVYQPLQITVNAVVPVKLIQFEANQKQRSVELNWQTAQEINNKGFFIERNTDLNNEGAWQEIGFINGNGNSQRINAYNFIDDDIMNSHATVIYYRLRQVDFDGAFEYSKIVAVLINKKPVVYPVPAKNEIFVDFTEPQTEPVVAIIYNANGSIVKEEVIQPKSNTLKIDVEKLSNGLYFLSIQTKYKPAETTKFFISK